MKSQRRNRERDEGTYIESAQYPAAVVVDIATDPNGTVLEAATGQPAMIYVAVEVEGKLKLARGERLFLLPVPVAVKRPSDGYEMASDDGL